MKNYLLITSFMIFVVVFTIWRLDSPYPLVLGWDVYAHQVLFNQIIQGNWSLYPTLISDTFLINAYTPLFAMILGLGKYLFFFLSQPGYYFVLDTAYLFGVVLLSVYIGIWVAGGNRFVPVISGLLGGFIYESVVAQTAFFFLPQGLAAGLVVLSVLFWFDGKNRLSLGIIFLAILLHFVIGGLGVVLLAIVIIGQEYTDLSRKYVVWGVLGVIGAVLLNLFFELDLLNTAESQIFLFTLQTLLKYINSWYAVSLLLYPIGLWVIWRRNEPKLVTIAVLSLLVVSVVLLPLPYSLKFMTVGRYFVHAVMAIGLGFFLTIFTRSYQKWLVVALFGCSLSILFYYNQASFKQAIRHDGFASTASLAEMDAAEFLRIQYENTKDVLLISDPATQHVMEGLSGVNTQGGAFMTQENRVALDQIFPQTDAAIVHDQLAFIDDVLLKQPAYKIVFAVSGRFVAWQRLPEEYRYSEGYNIWSPQDLTPDGFEYVQMLEKSGTFRKVFANEAMVLFEFDTYPR